MNSESVSETSLETRRPSESSNATRTRVSVALFQNTYPSSEQETVEKLETTRVLRVSTNEQVFYDGISRRVRETCATTYDEPMFAHLKQWKHDELLPWLATRFLRCFSLSPPQTTPPKKTSLSKSGEHENVGSRVAR